MMNKNVDTPVQSSSDTEEDSYEELSARLLEEIWHDVVVKRAEYSPELETASQW